MAEKGFLDIFYDDGVDGVYTRNVNQSVIGVNTQNSYYQSGYYLNAITGYSTWRGSGVIQNKGTNCGAISEGLSQLQPFAIQGFLRPYPIDGTHTPLNPTMSGLLEDPQNLVTNPRGILAIGSGPSYPANTPLYNVPGYPGDYEDTGLDLNGDGYGYFPVRIGDITRINPPGDGPEECDSNLLDVVEQSPRAYKIAPRVVVMSEHFRPFYRKFGRCTNNACNDVSSPTPKTISFYDINGNIQTSVVLATHFCGDPYSVDPSDAGMPELPGGSWQSEVGGGADTAYESPQIYNTIGLDSFPLNDMCVIITEEEIPDTVPTFRPITYDFVEKYFDESANPSTAQGSRVAVMIDQMQRAINYYVRLQEPNSENPSYRWISATNNTNIQPLLVGEEFSSTIVDTISYKMRTSAYYVRYDSYVNSLNDNRSIILSDIPQITELQHVDYDYRDFGSASLGNYMRGGAGYLTPTTQAGVRSGDSSSALLFPIEEADGTRSVGFWGSNFTAQYPALFLGNQQRVDALNYLCDAYGIDRPNYLDSTVDASPSVTPQDIRPTLGYKVYKSSVGQDGPFFDITDQIVSYSRTVLTSQTEGFPCIDPDVPCYTVHENFIDEFANEGDTLWYYVTRIEDNGLGGYFESDPSRLIEITVPDTPNEWSDSGERFLSRDNANKGVVGEFPTVNDEAFLIPPQSARTEHHIFDGYRMENNVSVPMLGYSPSGQTLIGTSVAVEPNERETYYRIDNPDAPDNDGVTEAIFPLDRTSYQYILGTPSSEGVTNFQFKLLYNNPYTGPNSARYNSWKNAAKYLNFTKYDPVRNENEPYMHSKLYADALGVVLSLSINPRGYGHKTDGASDWDSYFFDERTANPDSIIGYKMGKYFSQDVADILDTGFGTLHASGNAKNLSYPTGSLLDWFDASRIVDKFETLEYFDISNNGLYALKTIGAENSVYNSTRFAKQINISENNISSDNYQPNWRTNPAFGEHLWTDKLMIVENPTTYLNASNAGDFSVEVINKNQNIIEYLDISHTYLNTTGENTKRLASHTLKQFYFDSPKANPNGTPNNYRTLQFHGGGALETFNMTWETQGQGLHLIHFDDDPDVGPTSSQCGFGSLRHFNLIGSGVYYPRIVSINLGYAQEDDTGWSNRYSPLPAFNGTFLPSSDFAGGVAKEFTVPYLHGNLAPNLEIVDVSNCKDLRRLHLPRSGSEHDSLCTNVPEQRTFLSYVNISNTKLGINGTIDDFVDDAIAGYSVNTPVGHTLTLVAVGVRDGDTDNIAGITQAKLDSLKSSFSAAGKEFIYSGTIIPDE